MDDKDLVDRTAWIVCPTCLEKECVGKFECKTIKDYIDKHYKGK